MSIANVVVENASGAAAGAARARRGRSASAGAQNSGAAGPVAIRAHCSPALGCSAASRQTSHSLYSCTLLLSSARGVASLDGRPIAVSGTERW